MPCSCSWSSVVRKPRRLIPKNIGTTIYRAMMLFSPLHILACMCKIYSPFICRFCFTTPTKGVSKTLFLIGCCRFIPIQAHLTNLVSLTHFRNYLDIQSNNMWSSGYLHLLNMRCTQAMQGCRQQENVQPLIGPQNDVKKLIWFIYLNEMLCNTQQSIILKTL